MAQYLDPNADGASNAWTKSSGTTGWNLIDDGVRQPTTPNTTDNVNEVTSGDQQDVVFPDTGTYISGTWTLWTYCKGGNKRKIQYAISTNEGGSFGALADLAGAGTADAWRSVDVSGSITSQATLDGFRVRYQCVSTAGGGGATAVFVYAAYLEGPDTTVSLAGASAAASGASGALTVYVPVAGVSAAQSAALGNLSVVVPVAGVSAGVSGGAGVLSIVFSLAGVSAGQSTAAGALTVYVPVAGASAGQATVSASLSVYVPVAGASAAQATVSGALTVYVPVAGQVAATATASGALSVSAGGSNGNGKYKHAWPVIGSGLI
ncbi:MAG TPA: hypothetical protein VNN21_04230 [Dehalococcoidia bacterium]|nr:hypothetical protein [Dehalococcoidia bacterium]